VIYLKSFLFGVGGALIAGSLWITGTFILPLYGPYLMARLKGTGGGSSSSVVSSDSILLAALIGFMVAFVWKWQRLRSA